MSTDDHRRLFETVDLAREVQVHPATVENWLGRGYIRAYRVNGTGPILFDLDEVERAFSMLGPKKMRDGRRRGAKGRVVPIAVVATDRAGK